MWGSPSKDSFSSWIVTTTNNTDPNMDAEVGIGSDGESLTAFSDGGETAPSTTPETTTSPVVAAPTAENTATANEAAATKEQPVPYGTYGCQPYKVEILDKQLIGNSPGAGRRTAVIETLRQMGVQVFVIDAKNTETAEDTVNHIKRVVNFATRENSMHQRNGDLGYQRCLFFQDEQGRLFNLMMSRYVTGPVGTWKQYMDSFSGREAMMALTVLCRSVPCVANVDMVQNLKPAYLSLILGLVLSEEISLSWLNASMLIRVTSSISAHSLMSPVGSDVLRKIMLFVLVLAGATQGWVQSTLTVTGIIGACLILLSNLGSRTWHFMRWQPMKYTGRGSFFMAYLLAIGTGFILPYMGHRSIAIGGKGAMEYVITTSMLVAIVFMVSDFDGIQQFLVVGSDQCDQVYVNASVGIWWLVTTLLSLLLVRRIPYADQSPATGEKLLIEDHASPVGFKVPSLPDFEIDPSMADTGIKWLPLNLEFVVGSLLAFGVGAAVIGKAFVDWDEHLYALVGGLVEDI